jgi:hypothetical protein
MFCNYNASELFHAQEVEFITHKGKIIKLTHPFNLRFTNAINQSRKDAFNGPGIYAIYYMEELIYIGSYKSKQHKLIPDRWIRHISTLTCRGFNVGYTNKNLEIIPESYRTAFEKERNYRLRDTGVVTTPRRIEFAHANELVNLNIPLLLSRFTFHYAKIPIMLIKPLEKHLIQHFQPCANGTHYNKKHGKTTKHNIAELEKILCDTIKNKYEAGQVE